MGIFKMRKFCHFIFSIATISMVNGEQDSLPQIEQGMISESPSNTTTSSYNHILFLMHTGDTAKALEAYEEHTKRVGGHDFELIEKMGLILLDQGYRTRDPEIQILTLFGAGISLNEKALYILEGGLSSEQPELQLIALNFLSKYQNDKADEVIHRAMASNYLLIRLEAASKLAAKKDPRATAQTEALMAKVDERLWAVFPQIFAQSGDAQAMKMLRKLLTHTNEAVRIEAVAGIAKHGRDDMLPAVRRLASHHESAQQETCAAALGILGDESSKSRLDILAKNPNPSVKLAALGAIYRLGQKEVRHQIENMALNQDLYAINFLGSVPGSEEVLAGLLKSPSAHVRINAAISLLKLADPRCLPIVLELVIRDTKDLSLAKVTSYGKSLSAWKAIPSSQQNLKDDPVSGEVSLNLREDLLTQAVELPEEHFLKLASAIFETQQNELVPTLVFILENHPTPKVIELLKKYQQKAGAPLIRNYCNLALYKLKEPGPYADNLHQWVTQQRNVDLIRFRPVVPWSFRSEEETPFHLTPQETSRLLVDAFEAFVSTQDDKGIDMLISVIRTGNPKNKYALIGLLMRAIQ